MFFDFVSYYKDHNIIFSMLSIFIKVDGSILWLNK